MDELWSYGGINTSPEMLSPASIPGLLTELKSKLTSGVEKTQLQAIADLAVLKQAGAEVLQDYLLSKQNQRATPIEGKAYEILLRFDHPEVTLFLNNHFPQGVVSLDSVAAIDYTDLQKALASQQFQLADRVTMEKLCLLTGAASARRKWLYFTEVEQLPIADLQTINQLWLVHSEGKFGFSVQRQLWLGVQKNWDALWPKIGWRQGKKWARYPQEFIWDLSAPRGHLPLSNQLRGVQVINALLSHSAWLKT
jgi:GUN4-like/ARM-like repeat domain, GUN4-N terminal